MFLSDSVHSLHILIACTLSPCCWVGVWQPMLAASCVFPAFFVASIQLSLLAIHQSSRECFEHSCWSTVFRIWFRPGFSSVCAQGSIDLFHQKHGVKETIFRHSGLETKISWFVFRLTVRCATSPLHRLGAQTVVFQSSLSLLWSIDWNTLFTSFAARYSSMNEHSMSTFQRQHWFPRQSISLCSGCLSLSRSFSTDAREGGPCFSCLLFFVDSESSFSSNF